MNTELARFVAGRSNHPTLRRAAADTDGLSAQVGIVALLYGCKKGIHVDMNNFAD